MIKQHSCGVVASRRSMLLGALLPAVSSPAMAKEASWWEFARGWFSSLVAPGRNTQVPQVFGVDRQGRKKGLPDYRDKVVLLTFWASWCPTCRAELPQLAQLAKTFPKDRAELVTVNVYDTRPKMDKFLQQARLELDSLFDDSGEIVTSFGISTIPAVLLVDGTGKIVQKWRGHAPIAEVRQELLALLDQDKGKAPHA